jgi:hypothetical protein
MTVNEMEKQKPRHIITYFRAQEWALPTTKQITHVWIVQNRMTARPQDKWVSDVNFTQKQMNMTKWRMKTSIC